MTRDLEYEKRMLEDTGRKVELAEVRCSGCWGAGIWFGEECGPCFGTGKETVYVYADCQHSVEDLQCGIECDYYCLTPLGAQEYLDYTGEPFPLALVPYDPRFHVFDWQTVGDAAYQSLLNTIRACALQTEQTLASVREANEVIRQIRREMAA